MATRGRLIQSTFVLVYLVVASAGCGGGIYRTPINEDPLMAREQILLKGFGNAVSLSAVKAKAERLPAGQLKITVQIIKEALGSDFVEIMTMFIDKDGFEVEKTNWEPVHLEESVITQYETVSLGSRASDFRIVIRSPKDF